MSQSVFYPRHTTHCVHIRYANNDVTIGGKSPIRVADGGR